MQDKISYRDATVTVNAGLFGGVKIDVECRSIAWNSLSPDEFAAMIYPAIDAAATAKQAAIAPRPGESAPAPPTEK